MVRATKSKRRAAAREAGRAPFDPCHSPAAIEYDDDARSAVPVVIIADI
jgi:hypothetical protein